MIEKIAFYQNRNDEEPNIVLAIQLVKSKNTMGIREIVDGLGNKEKQVVNDCIKVLYEIGYRSPELINPHVGVFIDNLRSNNNRLVWGCCIALSLLADANSDKLYENIDAINKVYEEGSVITTDNSISIFAGIIRGNEKYAKTILPVLLTHLENCRPKEVAQHAERISVCINRKNKQGFVEVLMKRLDSLADAQKKRVVKLIKKIDGTP